MEAAVWASWEEMTATTRAIQENMEARISAILSTHAKLKETASRWSASW
jgi:hypothetical protein